MHGMLNTWKRAGRGRRGTVMSLAGIAAVLMAAGCGSTGSSAAGSSGAGGGQLVRAAANPALGTDVLVNRGGHTLYALSAERAGRFVCTRTSMVPGSTASCLSVWRPLTVRPGLAPTSTVGQLGTVRRPDGAGLQVTFRGMPLYTFAGDHRPGDASGNGFRDVGTWRAVTLGAASGAAPQPATGGYAGAGGGY
jgi:predicted lipoprotein with Yx(FWY)xxD motif